MNFQNDGFSIWYVACFICSQAPESIHGFASTLAQPSVSRRVQKESDGSLPE